MHTTHKAFEPSSKAFSPPAALDHLNPTERRFEVLIDGVAHVSRQLSALSLEKAQADLRANTATLFALAVAVQSNTEALVALRESLRPFANLRFLYRKLRSFYLRTN